MSASRKQSFGEGMVLTASLRLPGLLISFPKHQHPDYAKTSSQFIFLGWQSFAALIFISLYCSPLLNTPLVSGCWSCSLRGHELSKCTFVLSPWEGVAKSCLQTRLWPLTRRKHFWAPTSFCQKKGWRGGCGGELKVTEENTRAWSCYVPY